MTPTTPHYGPDAVQFPADTPPGNDPAIAAGLEAARQALRIEADAVASMIERVVPHLGTALSIILRSRGRVVVSGLGKSGHIGRKIAATLASTGTGSFFVHAGEALHGDAGMVIPDDVAVLISNSGETAEVDAFADLLGAMGVPIIAMTGRIDSPLARKATTVLDIGVSREADPLDLAPTASTTVTLALGDAIAAALMAIRGFGPEDFARRHPAGALGRKSQASRSDQGEEN